jgi:hypothetical protein
MKWILVFLQMSANGHAVINGSTYDPLANSGCETLIDCERDIVSKKALMGETFPGGMPVFLAIDPFYSRSFIPTVNGQWQ